MRVSRTLAAATLSLAAASLPAQSVPDGSAKLLQDSFAEVSGWILQTAEIVPAERYTYRPTAGVRTVGELLAHITDAYHYYCANAAGQRTAWTPATEKQGPHDKVTLQPKLKAATETCATAYQRGAPLPLLHNITHATLHYGNLVTYLRTMGLTPPSS